MKLSAFKKELGTVSELTFLLPDGSIVPNHFHVTEVGQVTKHFIDCGGTVRNERTVSLQLYKANDTGHRLSPGKLVKIIDLSEKVLNVEDAEIEVEYQGETIGKYGLEFDGMSFLLTSRQTACLASDNCGITDKKKEGLPELQTAGKGCCTPGGGCC
jgi:hypothetical protein